MLKKLNTPNALNSIISLILEFGILLDQITANIQRKNGALLRLNPKEETQSLEWALVNESNSCVEEIEMSFKQDDTETASCDANILKWEKEI